MNRSQELQRILLVDDDEDIRTVARMSLETVGGFEVVAAGSGAEALAALQMFRPDLALLDVRMPEMNGPALLSALRDNPDSADIPAIFMTASIQPEQVVAYRRLGVLEVIPKPFDPMTLPDVLRAIWSRGDD